LIVVVVETLNDLAILLYVSFSLFIRLSIVNDAYMYIFFMLRDDHPESVLSSMQTIMVVLLEESEDVREDLLSILLSKLGREKKVSISFINQFPVKGR